MDRVEQPAAVTDSTSLNALYEDVNAGRSVSALEKETPLTETALPANDTINFNDYANPYAAETDKTAAPASDSQEWTIAVDLNTTIKNDLGTAGAEVKMDALKDLAEQTKGTGVTIEAQYQVPAVPGETSGEPATLEHYVIKDGEITKLEDTKSKGIAQDLQDLVSSASHNNPSDKIGLIIQSHGHGPSGIGDGNGNTASLDEINDAISNGLEGSGKDKLDFLDFDSCVMATTETLDQTKDVAENLVASAETERAVIDEETHTPAGDGQNLNAALSELLKDPSMDGSELAEKFVDEAKEGSNGSDPSQPGGTPTLAHFDLSKTEQLDSALNDLGNTLAELAQDPKNKEVLQEDIESATRYAQKADPKEVKDAQNRDLKQVLDNVQASLDSGELSDPFGKLSQDLKNATAAQDAVTVSSYQEPLKNTEAPNETEVQSKPVDYSNTGGLSIFAPSEKFNDTQSSGAELNLLNNLSDATSEQPISQVSTPEQLANYQNRLKGLYEQITKSAVASEDGAAVNDAIKQDMEAVLSATSVDDFKKAAHDLNGDVTNLEGSEAYQAYNDLGVEAAERRNQKACQQAKEQDPSGWNNFINALA